MSAPAAEARDRSALAGGEAGSPVVMKFGGTSCESTEALERLACIVADRAASRNAGNAAGRAPEAPVVVVSAMARVTDKLVELSDLALAGDIATADGIIAQLKKRHLDTFHELAEGAAAAPPSASGARATAAAAVRRKVALPREIVEETEAALTGTFQELSELVRGVAAVGELTNRTRDAMMAFGERLSPWLARIALERIGLKTQRVDSRQVIVTDDQHTRALPLYPESQRQVDERLAPVVASGAIPVMGGFIAANRQGIGTTLGRGGSDFSAAILGALLGASRIEIWTDVNGMLTADPRVCPGAKRIKVMSFQEAAESAYFGAKVLHPSTLLPAMERGIPVWVLNSRAYGTAHWLSGPPNGEKTGTLITTRAPRTRTPVKCISCKRKITVIDVVSTRMLQAHGFLRAIWEVFAKYRCPVDMVSTSEVSVSLTISETDALTDIVDELGRFADVRFEGQKAILCLVGEGLRNTAGIAATALSALKDINLRMISQGASEINIGMVIEDEAVPLAMQRLHERFLQDLDPAIFEV